MINFEYFIKDCFSLDSFEQSKTYDYYICRYQKSERCRAVRNRVKAKEKIVLIKEGETAIDGELSLFIEWNFSENEYRKVILEEIDKINNDSNICVDISGFEIPILFFLLNSLHKKKYYSLFDCIYAEPKYYNGEENTLLMSNDSNVRCLEELTTGINADTQLDILIIAAGYHESSVRNIVTYKQKAEKILLFGLPSTSPDMFSQNILQIKNISAEIISEADFRALDNHLYAPAFDPFIVAQQIANKVPTKYSNLYLAPLSSKPHALGMFIFFKWASKEKKNITMLYPYPREYYEDSAVGIGKIWRYRVELPSMAHNSPQGERNPWEIR